MVKSIEVQRLDLDNFSSDELHEEAMQLKRFLYEDFRRLGATEDEARSIANPDDEQEVLMQLDKMLCPKHPSTVYAKLIHDGEVAGYTKIGPRLSGDEAPFGRLLRATAQLRELTQDPGDMPRGLHAFAIREGLAQAALTRIYYDLVPCDRPLVASVPKADGELQQAFTALGSDNTKAPSGIITLGSFATSYVRRVLPPHRRGK